MNSPDLLRTELAVRDLLTRYARLCDQRAVDAWAELFHPDARLQIRGVEFRGPAIRQWLVDQSSNPAGCHATMNVTVDCTGVDTAGAVADFVFVRRQAGTGPWEIVNVGRYDDKLLRTDGQWRFIERFITLH